MTDRLSPEQRSKLMKAVPTRNTTPELVVRKLLSRMGYRYRLHRRDLPGTPDLTFIGKRKAIFVNGCFWHSHSGCSKGKSPKSRLEYWGPKLKANQLRDERNQRELEERGWQVLVVWQCETNDEFSLRTLLGRFLGRN